MTYVAIEHFRPSLLVVRNAIVSDFADTARAADSRIGEAAFLDSHYFYKYLQEGAIPDYRLVKDFGTVKIYESFGETRARQIRWSKLVVMFGERKALGVAKARETLAAVNMAAGNVEEAQRQREVSQRARNTDHERYTKAVELLRSGLLDEATEIFDEVVTMVKARPDSYRAAIAQHIARSYFESSYFHEAAEKAQEAVLIHVPLVEAHFELGVFLLAEGQVTAADSVFRNAKARFGSAHYGRNLLSQLVSHGIEREAAQRAIDQHFPQRPR